MYLVLSICSTLGLGIQVFDQKTKHTSHAPYIAHAPDKRLLKAGVVSPSWTCTIDSSKDLYILRAWLVYWKKRVK